MSPSRPSAFFSTFSRPVFALVLGCVCPLSMKAAKDADLPPVLGKVGAPLKMDAFEGTAMGEGWSVPKGDWRVKDGALVGREKPEDKHAAVCALKLPNKNSIIRFSYRLQGAKSFGLSLNHEKGHLFRVNFSQGSVTLMKDKDKTNPESKGGLLAAADFKSEPGAWTTVQLEMVGDKIAFTTDGGIKMEASDPALNVAKPGYRFVVSGESVEIANLKIWAAAE